MPHQVTRTLLRSELDVSVPMPVYTRHIMGMDNKQRLTQRMHTPPATPPLTCPPAMWGHSHTSTHVPPPAPEAIVPSRRSFFFVGWGVFWYGAYSTEQRYWLPRLPTNTWPSKAALKATTPSGDTKLMYAREKITCFALHTKQPHVAVR
eukprot:363371-Chlamydomonas_euryale.AAC.11